MDIGKTLNVTEREEWRAWLERNHANEREIWLVLPNKASGKPRIPYNDAVEEALCFGWIDSIQKKLDEHHSAQRFTPRRAGSPLSEMNKERIRRLQDEGKMTPAGFAAIGGTVDDKFVVPDDILTALQTDGETWQNFQAFPESYMRIRVGWIDGARNRPKVFETRLRYLIKMTKRNKRFGMVQ